MHRFFASLRMTGEGLRMTGFFLCTFLFVSHMVFAEGQTASAPSQSAQATTVPANQENQVKASEPPTTLPAVLVSKETGRVSTETETRQEEGEVQGKTNDTAALPSDVAPVEENEPSPAVSSVLTAKEAPTASGGIKLVAKTISGEIGARGASGIALVYEKDEKKRSSKEIWFPYESDQKLIGYSATKDIQEGDLVEVAYEEAEDGSMRVLKSIILEKRKPAEEPAAEEETEEEESDE